MATQSSTTQKRTFLFRKKLFSGRLLENVDLQFDLKCLYIKILMYSF